MNAEDWPWQHDFPPFYTIQPNSATLKNQLAAWSKLVLDFHGQSKRYLLDVHEISDSPLFSNDKIKRSLPTEGILKVLDHLMSTGHAEPLDKSRNRWYIYWHTLDEWADIIYKWVQDNGQTDSVCTLYELQTHENTEFQSMQTDVMIKVLKVLEKRGCAELIIDNEMVGVKFL